MELENYTVYVDMDGVVADFDQGVNNITNGRYGDPDYSKSQMWRDIKYYNQYRDLFYETLPKKTDADQLMRFVDETFDTVIFLTATGTAFKGIAQQKRNWINSNYPGHKVITVVKTADKAVYANPSCILIDDRSKAIDPWVRAGGIGVLHDSTENTITKLNKLL